MKLHDLISSEPAHKAVSGFLATIFLAAPAWMENTEQILRIFSLLCSVGAGITTMVLTIKNIRKGKNDTSKNS